MFIIAFSCGDEYTTFQGPFYVRFSTTTTLVDENASAGRVIRLHYAGKKSTEDIEIQLSVTGGTAGVDFTYESGGPTLVIPAGEFFTELSVKPINNDINDGDQAVKFTVESVSGGFDAGFGLVGKTFTYTIKDDDCATPSLAGKYSVYNRETNPAHCGSPANDAAYAYEATITLVSEDGDNRVYEISDITGGLYSKCYTNGGENTAKISTSRFQISLTDQPDIVYGGGDVFNGTGLLECNGNFVLRWSNGFGDKATSYYTKK